MSIHLREIRTEDLEVIMAWRMDPDITRYMNTDPQLTLEGQRKWFHSISQNTDVLYWLIEIDGERAGVINLTGLDCPRGSLGWAYYIGEKRLRSMKTALALEMNLYDYAFDVLGKKELVGDIFTLNRGVIQLHLLCGSQIMEEKKNHVYKNGQYYDVTFMHITAERWREIRDNKKYDKISFGIGTGGRANHSGQVKTDTQANAAPK